MDERPSDSQRSSHGARDHDRRHAREGERGRHRARKERVLHTRISEQLAEDVRRMADELRVPVSNLVRTVLEEAVDAVESVSDNVGGLLEEVVAEAERAREGLRRRRERRREAPEPAAADEFADVLGWQPLVLHRAQRCAGCAAELVRGTRAWAAATERGLGSAYLCGDCLEARR